MENADPRPNRPLNISRATLVRDIIALQVKLVVDGLRDLLLVPVSIVAGVVSLVHKGDQPGDAFYRLLRIGRRSEHFINLFGAADRLAPEDDGGREPVNDIDSFVRKVEDFVVDEYRRGEMSKQAKDHLDKFLDSLNRGGKN